MFRAKGFILSLFTAALLFSGSQLFAQSSEVSISKGTYVTVSGNLHISTILMMSKSSKQPTIKFTEGSSWTGASASRFLDGNVMVAHKNPFVFPIGANKVFRPIAISGAANTVASFYDRNPAKISSKSLASKTTTTSKTAIEQLNQEGYWALDGKSATTVSLTYGAETQLEELTKGDLNKLSIVGYRNGQWEVISSTIDKYAVNTSTYQAATDKSKSNFLNGSITTNSEIIPTDYEYFTLAATQVEKTVEATTFSMFPNPSLTRLPLNVNYQLAVPGDATLRVYTATGSLLAERTLKAENGTISLSGITTRSGTYMVSITDAEGGVVNQKLLVAVE